MEAYSQKIQSTPLSSFSFVDALKAPKKQQKQETKTASQKPIPFVFEVQEISNDDKEEKRIKRFGNYRREIKGLTNKIRKYENKLDRYEEAMDDYEDQIEEFEKTIEKQKNITTFYKCAFCVFTIIYAGCFYYFNGKF